MGAKLIWGLVGFTLCFRYCLVWRSYYQVPNEPGGTTLNEVFKTAFPSENENTSFVPIFKINCTVLPLPMKCLTSKSPSLVRRKTLTLFLSLKLIEVFENSSYSTNSCIEEVKRRWNFKMLPLVVHLRFSALPFCLYRLLNTLLSLCFIFRIVFYNISLTGVTLGRELINKYFLELRDKGMNPLAQIFLMSLHIFHETIFHVRYS